MGKEENNNVPAEPEDTIVGALDAMEELGKSDSPSARERGRPSSEKEFPIPSSADAPSDEEARELAAKFVAMMDESERVREEKLKEARAHLKEIPDNAVPLPSIERDDDLGEVTQVYRSAIQKENGTKAGEERTLEETLQGKFEEKPYSNPEDIKSVGSSLGQLQEIISSSIRSALNSGEKGVIDEAFAKAADYREQQEELGRSVRQGIKANPEEVTKIEAELDQYREQFKNLVVEAGKDPRAFGFL